MQHRTFSVDVKMFSALHTAARKAGSQASTQRTFMPEQESRDFKFYLITPQTVVRWIIAPADFRVHHIRPDRVYGREKAKTNHPPTSAMATTVTTTNEFPETFYSTVGRGTVRIFRTIRSWSWCPWALKPLCQTDLLIGSRYRLNLHRWSGPKRK